MSHIREQRPLRGLILLAAVAVALLLTACHSEASKSEPAEIVTTRFSVEGMTCDSCNQAIQGAVGKLAGVESCVADFQTGTAVVRHDAGAVPVATLQETIDRLGYQSKPEAAKTPEPAASQ
ncbi:Heavy-metal-associated domain-containing protein [Sulfidibacter corallicola]|uniref:Heavy-metal-associated domain-containing protein n=1 Tax=Sulfidibacter corallicola TaxID=2818388 RepID=A0A8A4TN39_SULCO|nr:heavy metal-associated domain-containing protein [Sulfidibacter corallicola]QTD51386.1 heavy-metal-associated domain-containing protein [Sulfidibacter corallicola]